VGNAEPPPTGRSLTHDERLRTARSIRNCRVTPAWWPPGGTPGRDHRHSAVCRAAAALPPEWR
jgi:hypothetical protein